MPGASDHVINPLFFNSAFALYIDSNLLAEHRESTLALWRLILALNVMLYLLRLDPVIFLEIELLNLDRTSSE
jgi:hypothetical protein